MTFGERLKQRREFLNLTREAVSAISGVSYVQVGRYETDVNHATSEAIAALAHALGVSCDWLLGISEVYGVDNLTKTEQQALALLRQHQPERQKVILDILKLM